MHVEDDKIYITIADNSLLELQKAFKKYLGTNNKSLTDELIA